MNKMKLSTICFTTCCLALFTSSPLLAANPIVTVQDLIADGGDGPGLEVKLSPNVNMGYTLEATGASFAINSENVSINYDATAAVQNRNEYGIASDYIGYYLRAIVAANIGVPTADDSGAFNANYTKM